MSKPTEDPIEREQEGGEAHEIGTPQGAVVYRAVRQDGADPSGGSFAAEFHYDSAMPTTDPRVDAYIARAADFAKPILEHLRAVVHEACPDVVETIKWRNPAFEHHGPLCGMSAFKEHCWFAFWKAALLAGERGIGEGPSPLDQFGRLTTVDDLPSRATLLRLIRKAARLNETGAKVSRPARAVAPRPLEVPDDLMAALRRRPEALATFEAFPPSHRKEYVEWITGAKREETRKRRLETAISQLAEGKSQNWKYERQRR